ncbi:hypothetical protein LJ656_13075 [Paraburkholderia sp. MMS20-SJTR3]|uniref:Uncharacterized protein n=1 Tax=Paraburkholderia sejongensis TaxID=2886946 RepID=A0ABS8JUV5_9BURK|nr:hypothetical protein [Paraburkholderia sp. MMS20-SJTR3]MCC8393525.1 hypothetical protein [Paraburkholderia sp. MMS20-SJTR3]
MRPATRSFAAVRFGAASAAIALTLSTAVCAATVAGTSAQFAWPGSFVVLGDGYPHAGDACRRLGESAATANYLDHMAMLVGCPGPANSAAARAILKQRRARVVGAADGVTLISISTEGGAAAQRNKLAPRDQSPFTSTGTLPCERGGGQTKTMCKFGIVRHDDHSATLLVYWLDGTTRAILFGANGRVIGTAASANAQPMPGNTLTQKNAGVNLISIGNERYAVEDKVLSGN